MRKESSAQVALVTGAGAGIGRELTRRLLAGGWEVAALIRSGFAEEDDVIREAVSRGQLRVYRADLADFAQLRRVLEQIKGAEGRIDLLFNNAGGSFAELMFSPQGRELHYELHTVVPYIVLTELKEWLQKGERKTVVNTSSQALRYVKRFDPDALSRPTAFKKLFGPYATSKLALSLWTQELAARTGSEGWHLLSVDPGSNNTLRKDKKSGLPWPVKLMMRFFFSPPAKGAELLLNAAKQADVLPPGSFVLKGQPADLPFAEAGPKVLAGVRDIYEREFKR